MAILICLTGDIEEELAARTSLKKYAMLDFQKALRSVGLASLLASIGCEGAARQPSAVPTAKASALDSASSDHVASHQGPTAKTIGGIRFEIPAEWEEKPLASTVLLAEYSLPGDVGPGRLTLSTAAGGTAANIDRWKGQIRRGPSDPEAKETTISAAGKNSTQIEIAGTFTDMFGGKGPQPGWQLLGVAIPIDDDHNYFIKLTGPQATIAAQRAKFEQFVRSAKYQE